MKRKRCDEMRKQAIIINYISNDVLNFLFLFLFFLPLLKLLDFVFVLVFYFFFFFFNLSFPLPSTNTSGWSAKCSGRRQNAPRSLGWGLFSARRAARNSSIRRRESSQAGKSGSQYLTLGPRSWHACITSYTGSRFFHMVFFKGIWKLKEKKRKKRGRRERKKEKRKK